MSTPGTNMVAAVEQRPGRGATRQRRVFGRVIGSASSLLLIAVVLMVNYLAFRHYKRLDWTSEGMFTLSPKSIKVLRELDQDIDLYLFLAQGEANFASTDELIKRYTAHSTRLRVHYVDPEREAAEFKLLAQRFGILGGVTETGEVRADVAAVVARGDKNWHVNRDDLVGWDSAAAGPEPDSEHEQLSVKAEQALTGAILQVVMGRASKVCVTRGHAEWSLEEGEERSLAGLKHALRHDNIEWVGIDTLGAKEVPRDCDAVLVPGPERAFSESEAKRVVDYVRGGGNAWLALDPVIEHDQIQPTGFEAELKSLGVRLDRSLAVELSAKHLLSPSPVQFMVTGFGDHVTTRPLKDRARVVVALARSLSVEQPSDRIEVLLRTSAEAYGATDIARVLAGNQEAVRQAGDIAGPLDLAYAIQTQREGGDPAQQRKPGGRLVVVGDSDLLQPALLDAPELANYDLASAWTGWLTQRQALIEIPPKKVRGGNIVFTQDVLFTLLLRVGVLLPGAALLLGVAMWLQRRS